MESEIFIEDFIPYGHANAIKRDELVSMFAASDRAVRLSIECARNRGVVILNMQDGKGYFRPLPTETELISRAYNQEYRRAMQILKSIKQLHALADDAESGRLCAMETT